MTIFYSAATGGFYDDAIATEIPEGAIEVSSEQMTSLFDGQAKGKVITSDKGGAPVLVDAPEPTDAEMLSLSQVKRDTLLSTAMLRISPLQDIVDGYGETDATDAEKASLTAWKKYRAALSRVTTQSGWPRNVDWPAVPAA